MGQEEIVKEGQDEQGDQGQCGLQALPVGSGAASDFDLFD
jgi:hypothetical protein